MKKLTLEQVRIRFEKQDCKFLDNFYEHIKYEHNFLCSCGNVDKIHVNNFTNGIRCNICSDKKIPLEDVKKEFQKHICEFLDQEYISNKHPHNYKCYCGNMEKISLKNLRRSNGCSMCGKFKRKSLNYVKNFFEKNGCQMLEESFPGFNVPMKYRCKCGKENTIRFNDFKKGQRCYECSGRVRHTLDSVRKLFINNNCIFLDDFYLSSSHNHNYQCECGNKSKTTVSSFIRGRRCSKCSDKTKHTLEEIKKEFEKRECLFLDNYYKDNKHRHNYICKCGLVGKTSLTNIKKTSYCRGCCENGGFKINKTGYLYLIKKPNKFKIGIYNKGARRMRFHILKGWELVDQKEYEIGQYAYEEELQIKKMLKEKNIPTGPKAFREFFDGYTEAWNAVDLDVISLDDLFAKLKK
jgi:hypothetical protein